MSREASALQSAERRVKQGAGASDPNAFWKNQASGKAMSTSLRERGSTSAMNTEPHPPDVVIKLPKADM